MTENKREEIIAAIREQIIEMQENFENIYNTRIINAQTSEERNKYVEFKNNKMNEFRKALANYENLLNYYEKTKDSSIYTAIQDVRYTFKEDDTKKEMNELNKRYNKDEEKAKEEINKKLNEKLKNTISDIHKCGIRFVQTGKNNKLEIDKALNSIINNKEKILDKNYPRTEENFKISKETEEKLEVLKEYEEKLKSGVIEEKIESQRIVFKTKANFNPRKALVESKEKLKEIVSSERKISALENAISEIKKSEKKEEFNKTLEYLIKLKENEKKKLSKNLESFEKTNFNIIKNKVEQSNKEEKISKQINIYAQAYATYLEAKLAGNKNIVDLENDYLILGNGLTEEQQREGKIKGEAIINKKQAELENKKNEETQKKLDEYEKIKKEKEIREKLEEELYRRGYTPEQIPSKIEEELPGRIREIEKMEQEKAHFDSLTKEDKEAYIKEKQEQDDYYENMSSEKKAAIIQNEMEKEEFYEKLAFQDLKRDGTFPKETTIDTLNQVQKNQLKYFTDRKKMEIMDNFKRAKEEYEKYMQEEREMKTEKNVSHGRGM